MVDLSQEYGLSQKTGYKFKVRFEQQGDEVLSDVSRAPKVVPRWTSRSLGARPASPPTRWRRQM